jgi:hypothetical protein
VEVVPPNKPSALETVCKEQWRHKGVGRGRRRWQQRRLHVRRSDACHYLKFVEAILLFSVDLQHISDHGAQGVVHLLHDGSQHLVSPLRGGGHGEENKRGRVDVGDNGVNGGWLRIPN